MSTMSCKGTSALESMLSIYSCIFNVVIYSSWLSDPKQYNPERYRNDDVCVCVCVWAIRLRRIHFVCNLCAAVYIMRSIRGLRAHARAHPSTPSRVYFYPVFVRLSQYNAVTLFTVHIIIIKYRFVYLKSEKKTPPIPKSGPPQRAENRQKGGPQKSNGCGCGCLLFERAWRRRSSLSINRQQ